MLHELLHFAKLQRREVVVFKDLEKCKATKQKIAIRKSELGVRNDDLPALPSTLSAFTAVTIVLTPHVQ